MVSAQDWNSNLYDNKLGMVSVLGKGVVELLAPVRGESILDLGCGTGDLAHQIQQSGAVVTGMDLSSGMIEKARLKYPSIRFVEGNAEQFSLDETFDAVFSNAALHWMKQPEKVLSCIWNSLRPQGRFVAEFGGKGNVQTVIHAINEVLVQYGIDPKTLNPWYFPSVGEYSTLLERQGFRVTYAAHFERPTKMEDGEEGLYHWLNTFAGAYFQGVSDSDRTMVYEKIAETARKQLFYEGSWHVDYKRLRIYAIKP